MNFVHLAWRNLLRNRRRSALTLAAIAVSSIAILLFGGYVNSTVLGMHTGTIRNVGHLQIMPKGYLDFGRSNPGRFSIHQYQALIDQIETDPELKSLVTVVTPVLHLGGVAGNFAAGVSSSFFAQGVIPGDQRRMESWDALDTRIPPPTQYLDDKVPEGGVIGQGLAQLLALCEPLQLKNCKQMPAEQLNRTGSGEALPDDVAALASATGNAKSAQKSSPVTQIELLAASPSGAPNVMQMQVLRADRHGQREVDNAMIALPLPFAQRLVFGPNEKAVSAIVVQLKDSKQIERARARLQSIVAKADQPLEVLDFHVIFPYHDQVIGMFKAIFLFISILMGVVSLFSIANAVNMAVSERTGEIGSLRALGLTRAHIRRMFVTEGTLLGLVGVASGVAFSLLLTEGLVNHAGLSWTPPGNTTPVPVRVDVLSDPALMIGTLIVLTLLACISAWIPARRAARMEVVEALRHA